MQIYIDSHSVDTQRHAGIPDRKCPAREEAGAKGRAWTSYLVRSRLDEHVRTQEYEKTRGRSVSESQGKADE